MASPAEIRSLRLLQSSPAVTSLANEECLFDQIALAELVEEWIVPQLVEQWIEAQRIRTTDESEDNGEHS